MPTNKTIISIDISKHNTLSNILENSGIKNSNIGILNENELCQNGYDSLVNMVSVLKTNMFPITENSNDSNDSIEEAASKAKFPKVDDIDGDKDNSFKEGSDDDSIIDKLDDNGNYVGKGKTTIYDKEIDLKNPENSTERWVETPTGKASDGETEQVPNPQGLTNLNEAEMDIKDISPIGEEPSEEELKKHGMTRKDLDSKPKVNIDEYKNPKTNTSSVIRNLINSSNSTNSKK